MLIGNDEQSVDTTKSLYSLNVTEISDEEKHQLVEQLIDIAYPNGLYQTKAEVAKALLKFFDDKKGSTISYGAATELLLTFVIRSMSFEQAHAFRNLEEGSIKKGFDGFYRDSNENTWIFESKSTLLTDANRGNTLSLAYNGLKQMLAGETSNNPWANAYNHALSAQKTGSILNQIRALNQKYEQNDFLTINESNVILGSTVITDDADYLQNTLEDLRNPILKHESQNEIVLAMNLKSIQLLMDVLEEVANE